jgi:formamidopyrimidine-DNA glycosylase
MPELPEVEVTCRGIAPALTGNRVFAVIARTPALRYPLPENLEQKLVGQRLAAVSRRGKYLLLDFGHGHLLIHLGMSGSLRLVPAGQPAEKHDHFDLVFVIGRKKAGFAPARSATFRRHSLARAGCARASAADRTRHRALDG